MLYASLGHANILTLNFTYLMHLFNRFAMKINLAYFNTPIQTCFYLFFQPPCLIKTAVMKKHNMEGINQEVDLYIKNISDKFGKFEHAPVRTPFDPRREEEQIKMLYPLVSMISIVLFYVHFLFHPLLRIDEMDTCDGQNVLGQK